MHRRPADLHAARRPVARRARLALAATVLGGLVAAGSAMAVSIPERTARLSENGGVSTNGISTRPALAGDGALVAFETTAFDFVPDGNGPVRDIVAVSLLDGSRVLVSAGPGGAAADGPSVDPAVSGDGSTVAFTSSASNLVAGDTNRSADVFVRVDNAPVRRVSVGPGGVQGTGISGEPDVSGDGRFVAFSSTSPNLVAGDDNGRRDVFVHDLVTRRTERVSNGAGYSDAPAISADGRYVSFFSSSSELVDDDLNELGDVFVYDRAANRYDRVSVSSRGDEQNRSVIDPFSQLSDISANGRYVAFDSDATTLVRGDENRDTDVFVRDRRANRTERVSISSGNEEGDNDSFAPSLTGDGRFVAFESFAENLAPGSPPGEDVFLHERRIGATSLLDVSAAGEPREPERVRQLLQRPMVSDNGRLAVFTSTANGLVPGDQNDVEDVFLRFLAPPAVTASGPDGQVGRRIELELAADDPRADQFLCRLNARGPNFPCRDGRTTLPQRLLKPGRNRLTVRAGGLGMRYGRAETLTLDVDRRRPSVRISPLRGTPLRTVRGRASDSGAGVDHVEVSVVYFDGRGCRRLVGDDFRRVSCGANPSYERATGARTWRLRLPRGVRGPVLVRARAVDEAGNRSRTRERERVIR